ncbi:unnamed protein product [Paramecium sonneborni]|uniref:Uncharacterized protein n=1 Tax=Paramecium sonneborni TaxID=65129 RepID=A0A8S1RGG5_9CILI|nr:unnamed protein product [Paramecium sonneborni]
MSESNDNGYCYGQGYDAAAGNYDPSTEETIAQGVDALICEVTGNGGAYQQGYIDGYNQTNPNASGKSK